MLRVTVCDGKYTVMQREDGGVEALRHNEEWRDCCGDGLILGLAQEVETLREIILSAENCLVCAAITDPIEVCVNTLKILKERSDSC